MAITKNKLRELKIFNPYGLAKAGRSKLYIGYDLGESGRMAHYPQWTVVGVDFKVEPNSPWYNHGNKTFSVSCRENKIPMLNEAIQWCYEKFGIPKDQWEKDQFGGYQIAGTIKKAISQQSQN